jgi:hypothetical protein
VSVVCWQVEVSATSWPLVQGSPTDCCASLCVIQKPHMRSQTPIVIELKKKQEIYHWRHLLHAINSQPAHQLIEYCVLWLLVKREREREREYIVLSYCFSRDIVAKYIIITWCVVVWTYM